MAHADDGGFGDGRMADGDVLDLDGGNPFAARFDHVLGAVGDGHIAVRVDGGDVARVEPAVVIERALPFASEIGFGDGRPAHFQPSERLAVMRQLAVFVVRDLHLDAERRMALFDLEGEAFFERQVLQHAS